MYSGAFVRANHIRAATFGVIHQRQRHTCVHFVVLLQRSEASPRSGARGPNTPISRQRPRSPFAPRPTRCFPNPISDSLGLCVGSISRLYTSCQMAFANCSSYCQLSCCVARPKFDFRFFDLAAHYLKNPAASFLTVILEEAEFGRKTLLSAG